MEASVPISSDKSSHVARKDMSSNTSQKKVPSKKKGKECNKEGKSDKSIKSDSKSAKSKSLSQKSKTTGDAANPKMDNSKKLKGVSQTAKAAPKKKKKTFQDELLYHMFMSCKPFTLKLLSEQMKSSESSVNFCLLSLVDKKWVIKKEFTSKGGSRTKELFWANQKCTAKELVDSLQLVPLDVIRETRQEFAGVMKQEIILAKELEQVLQQPSNEDLATQIANSESDVQELRRKLDETHNRINSVKVEGQKPMCQKSVKKRINTMRGEWKKRKDKCVDFLENLADGLDKKVKDVVKQLDIETDESVAAKMPPKYIID